MMTRNLIMRKMLISIKPDVYERIRNGTKIFEHRKVFPNEPIMAYMYVSSPVKAITGILCLSNRTEYLPWKDKCSYDNEAIKRIDEYMKHYNVVMQINDSYETNMITLKQLRKDMEKFVVPQMYYSLDNLPLLNYIENNIEKTNLHKHHDFSNISSNDVCVH